ncbi:alpha-(1,3)-fucosyltransferase C [Tribolium castaneum]|uniref:Fucosyltransferase n=1 Tax=Tribolium castaneum TaxID=7070 RepID=D6WT65_TRICA|nr:PREDICTED: alpha-(1,3)-fucosyltransferase C [Tribolium castaneum]XP_974256.1 PREDICTED: alpha-(1,3)-fucosyltransferase C [Tribolium castaneum]EFA05856.1 Alpha-(1,3)-fucosyltransferase C-like Protein [Tribolium castaneum]|eukprot:XP_015837155.1 PREDICTED: alpha-(1,3)-fucosyltransferase C [Tribolium castaneum]
MVTFHKLLFIILGLLIATIFLLSQYRTELTPPQTLKRNVDDKPTFLDNNDTKTILYWTPMFQSLNFYLGLGSKIFEKCAYNNCYATYVKNERPVEKFDAIIFHGVEYQEKWFGKPQKRNPNQVYIFSNQESPVNTPSFIRDFDNFYNWTMTYRLDSDILRPYGFLVKQKTGYKLPTVEEIQKRPKKIAWFVSNCGTSSERELLVNEIQKEIHVDVYGRCGTLHCEKNNKEGCYDMMERKYKFYLSFENSICEDYVTEKLYNVLQRNIVPIVYGGADYNTLAPPKSVINVMDFMSVKHLVKHLKYLDSHPEEYLKFLEWKKDYIVETASTQTLCTLCQKLNEPIKQKIYNDITKWWAGKDLDKCMVSKNGFLDKYLLQS